MKAILLFGTNFFLPKAEGNGIDALKTVRILNFLATIASLIKVVNSLVWADFDRKRLSVPEDPAGIIHRLMEHNNNYFTITIKGCSSCRLQQLVEVGC